MAAIALEELLKKVGVCPEKFDKAISDDHLREVALFLTSWRVVAVYLELSDNDLGDVEQEGKDEQDKRLKALQKWKGKFGYKATYKKLVQVLLSIAKADIAEKICHLLKGNVQFIHIHNLVSWPQPNFPSLAILQSIGIAHPWEVHSSL